MRTRAIRQEGAALITAMIILVIMMMVGTVGMENTVLEEKMVINSHSREIAENAADSTTRETQAWLRKVDDAPTEIAIKASECSTPPLCGGLPGEMPIWLDNSLVTSTQSWQDKTWAWWKNYAIEYDGSGTTASQLADVAEQPVSLVEFRSFNAASTTTGMAINLNPNESSLGRGWHFYNVYGAGVGPEENALAAVETTVKKWH